MHEVLAPDGLFGVQMITVPDCRYAQPEEGRGLDSKTHFPGITAAERRPHQRGPAQTGDLFMHDLEDLGADYARTLSTWCDNFNAVLRRGEGAGFRRAASSANWNYYLKYCEAAFASRNISVVQAVYTRPNNPACTIDSRRAGHDVGCRVHWRSL